MNFGVTSHFDGTAAARVFPEVAENVMLTLPWDIDQTRRIIGSDDNLAAAILEPTGSVWGQVPVTTSLLNGLRDITAERGVVLIFDEVITSFRCALGGVQEATGITPDLACLGKIVAGGMHGAALLAAKTSWTCSTFATRVPLVSKRLSIQGLIMRCPPVVPPESLRWRLLSRPTSANR